MTDQVVDDRVEVGSDRDQILGAALEESHAPQGVCFRHGPTVAKRVWQA